MGRLLGSKNKTSKKIKMRCDYCGEEYLIYPARIRAKQKRKDKHSYCSTKCRGIAKKSWVVPEKTRKRISDANKGKIRTDKQKERYKESKLGSKNPMYGKEAWNKGRKMDDYPQMGFQKGHEPYGPVGENHYRWIKDREAIKRNERNDSGYLQWVKEVKKRDKNICRIKDENCSGYNIAHHIRSWSEYLKLRYKINNGITLCQAHHPRKRAEEKRLIPVFEELVPVSSG